MSLASGAQRRVAPLLVIALALAACGGNNPATNTPASAVPTVAVTPAPTVDVSAAFIEAMKAFDSGVVAYDATATVGTIEVTLDGESTFDGDDSAGTITTTVLGKAVAVETVSVGGKTYTKTGTGPWLAGPASANGGVDELTELEGTDLTDAGVEIFKGQPAHRLKADAADFDPASLGLGSADGMSNVEVSVAYFATDDGTPVGATVEISWTQKSGAASLPAHMMMDLTFSDVGEPQTIEVPDDVWQAFTSDRYAFKLTFPNDWTTEEGEFWDFFDNPDGTQFMGAGRDNAAGDTLASLGKTEAGVLKEEFKTDTVKNEGTTIGGVDARLLTLSGTGEDGEAFVQELVFVKGKFVYYVFLISPTGSEAADTTLFQQIAGTFAFE